MRNPRDREESRRRGRRAWRTAALYGFFCLAGIPRLLGAALLVEGRIVDQTGKPVSGARVFAKGGDPAGAAVTAADGKFRLELAQVQGAVIVVEAPGFVTARRSVDAADSRRPIIVPLTASSFSDAVTVSASRSPSRLRDTASSIVLLTDQDLQSTAAPATDAALREVPGFTLFRRTDSRAANPTTQGVSLRGVGGSGASRAAVLDDLVPMNDPFGGWIEWGRVPRAAIDRIDVLRGGASDLYGGSALAGAIALWRREPRFSGVWAEAALGSAQERDASVLLSGTRGPWSARLSGDVFDTGGYVGVAPSERGPIDSPLTTRHDAVDVTLERGDPEVGRVFVRGNYFDESRGNGTPLQTNDTRMTQMTAGADWPDVGGGEASVRVYGVSERYHQIFSAIASDRASERLTDRQTVPSGAAGLMWQWRRTWGRHRFVAGLEAAQVRGASDEILGSAGASFSNAGGRQRTASAFIGDSVSLGERWAVSAGARLDFWRNFDATQTKGPTAEAGTRIELPSRSESAVSPRASVLFRAGSTVTATASAYRSFRAPTLNELYRSFQLGNTLTLANANLSAEHLTGGDLGAIWTGLGGRLLARGVLFWTEIDHTITNVTLAATPTAITRQRQNLGRTRSRGLEWDGEAALNPSLTLSAGYLFADTSVVSASDASLEGLWVTQVPRHQGSLRVRYQIGPVALSAQGRWIGNQFEDDQNRLPLGSASVADLMIQTGVLRGVEVFGACENVFDAQYTVARTPARSIGQPRSLRFGLRIRPAFD